jgi:hypothetical protein
MAETQPTDPIPASPMDLTEVGVNVVVGRVSGLMNRNRILTVADWNRVIAEATAFEAQVRRLGL